MLEVAEVYHYENWAKFDGKDPETGLFTKYINAFLKLKQQASGWPAWVTVNGDPVKTEENKAKYIMDYEAREGIKLEADMIEKNPAMRSLAKLCLNSFWVSFVVVFVPALYL